jgi:hypothetical protein
MRRPLRVLLVLMALCFGACAPEGPSAFVTFNITPDANCVFAPDATTFFGIGTYDIAEGGPTGGDYCKRPYVMHLLVNSYLRPNANTMIGRAEPNILQLHSAEVRLMDLNKKTLQFKGDKDSGALPNPFLVATNNSLFPASGTSPSIGVAAVETIPARYAPFLTMFNDSQILAEIQIFGTTTGDVDVDFKPFTYPIDICDGCLKYCANKQLKLNGDIKKRQDLIGDTCDDDSGNDNRICIDPDC